MDESVLFAVDSYKSSHFLQYPPGTTALHTYFESRGGLYPRTLFFGLSYILRRYLNKPVRAADVDEAAEFYPLHGEPFPVDGWDRVVDKYGGWLPVRIRAVPEGLVVPTRNALFTVESLDPELPWLTSWVETLLVRAWYPITVATQSFFMRRDIYKFLVETADDPDGEIDFKLHDFGARGSTTGESAGVGGAAHLISFKGSDTVEAVRLANKFYPIKMAGFSIPASEHSTVTSWGRKNEYAAYDNMIAKFGKAGSMFACVSDSYDLFAAIDYWIRQDKRLRELQTRAIPRPDSGEDPAAINVAVLDRFRDAGLMTKNTKGYLVLPPHYRLIQGDGVNRDSIRTILTALKEHGYSASNIGFGSGGALLQKLDRDTQKFAYKCSAMTTDGAWHDVYKDPITDPGKKSKPGRFDLVGDYEHGFETVRLRDDQIEAENTAMLTYYDRGEIMPAPGLDEVRKLAARAQ